MYLVIITLSTPYIYDATCLFLNWGGELPYQTHTIASLLPDRSGQLHSRWYGCYAKVVWTLCPGTCIWPPGVVHRMTHSYLEHNIIILHSQLLIWLSSTHWRLG